MFKPKESSQSEYEFVSIDELAPDDHLLRLIDKYINFSFLLEKVRPYYSDDNGRPTNPLILFKMMFIGYIYGIRSERQLEREILERKKLSEASQTQKSCTGFAIAGYGD